MNKKIRNVYYSFPIQLFLLHLRRNILLISIWILILLLMSGMVGRKLGIPYLFLDPEYLGNIGFLSFFFMGFAFAGFYMTWNMTTYLLTTHHFPFLASLARPFAKFTINNLVLPFGVFLYYLGLIIFFQSILEKWTLARVALNGLGFISGTVTLIVLNFLYFRFTNRDISYYDRRAQRAPNLLPGLAPGMRNVDLEYIKHDAHRLRVDTYLTESLRPRVVRSVAHYDTSLLMSIFKQNHLNALITQLLSMIILVLFGRLIDFPVFRIPAGASFFILMSIFTAIIGFVTYWFNEWRVLIFLLLLAALNYVTKYELFSFKSKAYGLNYDTPPAEYTYDKLSAICNSDQVELDKANTIEILENWKRKVTGHSTEKPKMVILSVSGGGLRSATWSMKVIQEADSLLGGKLLDHTVLITGASGGLIGMAYLRELYLLKKKGRPIDLYDAKYIDTISNDLLNSVFFTLVANDLFLPGSRFKLGEYVYQKDRGYIFEKQLHENTGGILDKTIGEYYRPEKEAQIPMLYITPSIVNDARRMIISPQGVSFMMIAPVGLDRRDAVEVDAVDFGWLFREQHAMNLQFSSALRMNATYPYVLPNIHLPTKPEIEVMDAGFRDNYGLLSATRFIQVFQDWIRENTSGVILLQISSSGKIEEIRPSENKGIIESLLNPLGIAGQLLILQEFEQDTNLGFIFDLLSEQQFHVIRLMYRPGFSNPLQASISFHLTEREKSVVLDAIQEEDNQSSLRQLVELMGSDTVKQ